jgi:hypothetical protein
MKGDGNDPVECHAVAANAYKASSWHTCVRVPFEA